MEYKPEDLKRIREIELDLYHELDRICKKYDLTYVTGFGTTLGAIRHQGFIPWDDDMDFLMPRKDYEKLVKVSAKELKGSRYEFLEPRTTKNYVMTFAKLSRKDSTFVEPSDKHFKYHTGVYIDIFPMDYWPQDKKKRDKLAFQCYCLRRAMTLSCYPRPKFPENLPSWKKVPALAGCRMIYIFMKLFRVTTEKLYRKYRYLASVTTPEEAEDYVTDMCWCWIRKIGIRGVEMFGLQYKDTDLFTTLMMPFEDDVVPVPDQYDSYLTIAYKDYMTIPPVEKQHCHMPEILELPED